MKYQTLNNKGQWPMKRQETSKVTILSLLPGEIPDRGTKSMESGRESPGISLSWDGAGSSRRPRCLQFTGQVPERRKLQRQRTLEKCWSSSSLQLINPCVWENYPRTTGNWRESSPKLLLFPLVRVETS